MSLSVEGLACGYPGRLVLDDVSFAVAPGEVAVLLGVNGSGKSTLLKTLIQVVPAIRGSVRAGEVQIERTNPRVVATQMAFVPQEEHSTFPFLARQIVMMGRLPYSQGLVDPACDHRRVETAMADADCLQYADRPITELSGGERQRVLIARALAADAPVLLLDEPSSHLDVAHVVGLTTLLRRLAASGKAVLAAVHDLNVASVMADRALLLADGRLLQDGRIQDVLSGPNLERAYGIKFDRMVDASGRLRVFPA